jgi:hypothetical protein
MFDSRMLRRIFRPMRDTVEGREDGIMRWEGHVAGSKVKVHTQFW